MTTRSLFVCLLILALFTIFIPAVLAQDVPTIQPSEIEGTLEPSIRPTAPARVAPSNDTVVVPPTLEELYAQNPDLMPALTQLAAMSPVDMDFALLYDTLFALYNSGGIEALAVYLRDSGLIETLGVPVGYIDLITRLNVEDPDLVQEEARTLGLITDVNEVRGFLRLDDTVQSADVAEALLIEGISAYAFNELSAELEIGIPLELLFQYQRSQLLELVTRITQIPGVDGFRLPELAVTLPAGLSEGS